jgi:transposase
MFRRWHLRLGEKRGGCVGKTKRGKGTKIMAIADGAGLPLAICIGSASPHEVTLVHEALAARFIDESPERLIGDRAYDSDRLRFELSDQGIELIAPHRANRKREKRQDGRPLRRYRKRWKVERLFAWLQAFRRIVVRYERHAENFLGMVQLGCIRILLRHPFMR